MYVQIYKNMYIRVCVCVRTCMSLQMCVDMYYVLISTIMRICAFNYNMKSFKQLYYINLFR